MPATQCTYREDRRRCKRNGTGNPVLCRAHRLALEEEVRTKNGIDGILNVFGKWWRKEPLTRDDLIGAYDAGAKILDPPHVKRAARGAPPQSDQFRERVVDAAYEQLQARARAARAAQAKQARPPPPPPGPDPAIMARCKFLLGWKPTQTVTVPDVNRRRRELAKKYHPDRPGGSVGKMAQINDAADRLITEIEKGPTA